MPQHCGARYAPLTLDLAEEAMLPAANYPHPKHFNSHSVLGAALYKDVELNLTSPPNESRK